jgi:hypothetical protein
LTVTNSELPGSQVPSADRRRELLATRNFSTSWSPTLRRFGSLTTLPTTVSGVSNISNSPFLYRTATGAAWTPFSSGSPTARSDSGRRRLALWRKRWVWINAPHLPQRSLAAATLVVPTYERKTLSSLAASGNFRSEAGKSCGPAFAATGVTLTA